ncbi:MAG TPA: nuclear transport factor 2 family protein [Longimicrobium sp.]|nr:nuclear transport factor 2 family protein [Longimicrobium sp.]
MTPTEQANLALALDYTASLENGGVPELLERVFTPDVVQEEFPNRLMPNGARRGLAEMRAGAERGRQVMASQRFQVLSSMPSGDRVALEVRWSGTPAIPLGSLAAGDTMRARFGVFLDVRDGRIAAQRNYDCFDPF